MKDENIAISDVEIREHIRERGSVGDSDWGPRKRLGWDEAKRELLVLREAKIISDAIDKRRFRKSDGGWGGNW